MLVQTKGCWWAMKPEKIETISAEFQKNFEKDPQRKEIKKGMVNPDIILALEQGEMKKDYDVISDSEDDEDSINPTEKIIRVRCSLQAPKRTSRENQEDQAAQEDH